MKPAEAYASLIARFGTLAVWGTAVAVVAVVALLGMGSCESGCSAWRDARSDAKHEEYKAKDDALQRQVDALSGRAVELERRFTEAEIKHQQELAEFEEKLNAVEQAKQRSQQTRTVYRDARRGRIPNASERVSDDELRELTEP